MNSNPKWNPDAGKALAEFHRKYGTIRHPDLLYREAEFQIEDIYEEVGADHQDADFQYTHFPIEINHEKAEIYIDHKSQAADTFGDRLSDAGINYKIVRK